MREVTRKSGRSGVAALEFALLVPVLVALFVGVADLSTAYHYDLQLTSALAAGAEYALNKGQADFGLVLNTEVAAFVNNVSAVPLTSVSATYNNGDLLPTSCYCVSGSPATYSAAMACGAACTDGSGATAGRYISISASFTYTAMSPLDTIFFRGPIAQTVMVRLK